MRSGAGTAPATAPASASTARSCRARPCTRSSAATHPASAMAPLSTDLLAIYLNDHLAGATAGAAVARRAAASNSSTAYGDVLADLAREIERDREALVEIMDRLSVGRDR